LFTGVKEARQEGGHCYGAQHIDLASFPLYMIWHTCLWC